MSWQPPLTFEEKIKSWFIPPRLYIRGRADKELKKGEAEAQLLPELVDPKRNAIDIGANKGVYAELLSRLCGKVYAFEPNPKLYKMLVRSAATNVKTYNMALSDKSGTAELRIPRNTGGGYSNQGASLSTYKVSDNFAVVTVEARPLDGMALENIGFIKIDVEGFELSVLKGAVETLKRERPVLLIEIEEIHTGRPLEQMVAEVENYGYQCKVLLAGDMVDFSKMDVEKHHRNAQARGDYIFNFIFFPT